VYASEYWTELQIREDSGDVRIYRVARIPSTSGLSLVVWNRFNEPEFTGLKSSQRELVKDSVGDDGTQIYAFAGGSNSRVYSTSAVCFDLQGYAPRR